eukprot:CFRG0963T1
MDGKYVNKIALICGDEKPPEGYVAIKRTPNGYKANLSKGLGKIKRMYLCVTYGNERPVTDIDVITLDGDETPPPGYYVIARTVGGKSANLHPGFGSKRTYITFTTQVCTKVMNRPIINLAIIVMSRGETPPENMFCLQKPVSHRLSSAKVYLCYQRDNPNALSRLSIPSPSCLTPLSMGSTARSCSMLADLHRSKTQESCYSPLVPSSMSTRNYYIHHDTCDESERDATEFGKTRNEFANLVNNSTDRLPSFASAVALIDSNTSFSSGCSNMSAPPDNPHTHKHGRTHSDPRQLSSNPRVRGEIAQRHVEPLVMSRAGSQGQWPNVVAEVSSAQPTPVIPPQEPLQGETGAIAYLPSFRSLAAVLDQTALIAPEETNSSDCGSISAYLGVTDGLPSYDEVEQKQSSSEYWKARGNESFLKGKYDEAVELFSAGLRLDPRNYTLLSNRSACYYETRDTNLALEDANAVVAIAPQWFKGYLRQGMAYEKMGGLKEALACYEKATELHTETGGLEMEELLINTRHALAEKIWATTMSKAYAAMDLARAADEIGQCIKFDPLNSTFDSGRVFYLLSEGKFKECVDAADAILDRLPTEVVVMVSKAIALVKLDRTIESLQTVIMGYDCLKKDQMSLLFSTNRLLLEAAVAAVAEHYQFEFKYADTVRVHEWGIVANCLHDVLSEVGLIMDMRVRCLVRSSRAMLLKSLDRHDECVSESQSVIADNPQWLPAYVTLGKVLQEKGSENEAATVRASGAKLADSLYMCRNDNVYGRSSDCPPEVNTDSSDNRDDNDFNLPCVDVVQGKMGDVLAANLSMRGDCYTHQCESMGIVWGGSRTDIVTTPAALNRFVLADICVHGMGMGAKDVHDSLNEYFSTQDS